MSKPYKLSAVLYGHSLDVRSLFVTNDNSILSGSRDKTAKFWKQNGFNTSYSEFMTYRDHKNFVGSVLYLEPTNEFPEGLVITGGYDNLILIYKPSETLSTCSFKEHTNSVCCLTKGILPNTFISGSWDTTAKFWNLGTKSDGSLVTFSGHSAAIWSILQLQDSRVVTASADKLIIMWSVNGQKLQTLTGHTDCVRGLCDMTDLNYFISVSNDASVKLWSYSGENLNSYYGHTNFIYGVARCKADGEDSFVTSDEDRSVRFWKNGINTVTIRLPAQSVWAVGCLSNGDIVTGSSDGVVRIFTQNEDRFADEATLNKFEEDVEALNRQSVQEIGGYKVSDLPGREALYDPGKKAGQMKMIREGGGVVAYTWVEDGDNSHWEKVGDVLGASNKENEGKTMFEGKMYDYVFSVDVEEGKPPVKLPYNKGDDPHQAAQNFLTKNALPSVYFNEVVDFILKNTTDQQFPISNDYVDPFTGASRYTPSSTNIATQAQGTNCDPFTGSSSYSTASAKKPAQHGTSGANLDPFTGSMSYTTNSVKRKTYFPQQNYLIFEMGDPSVILKKLKEFNEKISAGNVDDQALENVVEICKGPPNNSNTYNILRTLLDWPDDVIFPVLDVVRMSVRYIKNNEHMSTVNSDLLIQKLKSFASDECKIANNTIVALRTLSNLCIHEPGEKLIYENRFDILEQVTSLSNLNKNAQVALATLLLNMCILCLKKRDDLGTTVLADVLQDILMKLTDAESQFRAYVALGTLFLSETPEVREIKIKLTTNLTFLRILQEHSSSADSELERKRMNCAKEVSELFK